MASSGARSTGCPRPASSPAMPHMPGLLRGFGLALLRATAGGLAPAVRRGSVGHVTVVDVAVVDVPVGDLVRCGAEHRADQGRAHLAQGIDRPVDTTLAAEAGRREEDG